MGVGEFVVAVLGTAFAGIAAAGVLLPAWRRPKLRLRPQPNMSCEATARRDGACCRVRLTLVNVGPRGG